MKLLTTLLLLCLGSSKAERDPIVKTTYGAIKGYKTASLSGTEVKVFKSVPFAAPPIGNLRWKLPQKPESWQGIIDGTKYSAACMTNSTTSKSPQKWVSEDCLYLNIFAPAECSAENKCPVAVFYHGGGMNSDSAVYYNDSYLIETYPAKGVILVVPAFRLGFTGLFTLGDEDLIPSNLGFHDALFGLNFVKNEIKAFGGDKDEITLMGHSFGGGMSVWLAFSPMRKLQVPIKRVVSMSPSILFEPLSKNERLSKVMAERAGCSNDSKQVVLDCMMTKSGMELLTIQRQLDEERRSFDNMTLGGAIMTAPLFPFNSIPEMMRHAPDCDIMIGSTTGEMDYSSPVMYKGDGNAAFAGIKNAKELNDLYDALLMAGKMNQSHKATSQRVYLSVYVTARAMMEKGQKVFLYSYDQPTHNRHTDDLSYLMGIHSFDQNENEKEIAKFYPDLFLNFTKHGVPSPIWKPMTDKDNFYSVAVDLTTGRMPENRDDYQKETVDFWIKKAPRIDKLISARKAGGDKFDLSEIVNAFRDLKVNKTEIVHPYIDEGAIVIVHSSYFPTIFMITGVFLLGMVFGRYVLSGSSEEERMWILRPRRDLEPVPPYVEKLF